MFTMNDLLDDADAEVEIASMSPEERAELESYAAEWDSRVEWRHTLTRTLPIAIPSILIIIVALLAR